MSFLDLICTELLSPKLVELELQDIEEDAVLTNMQQEMEWNALAAQIL
jgi:hypothetical protein